jgi:hypothetical protein
MNRLLNYHAILNKNEGLRPISYLRICTVSTAPFSPRQHLKEALRLIMSQPAKAVEHLLPDQRPASGNRMSKRI